MQGVNTSEEVLLDPLLIIRGFGLGCFLHCLKVLTTRQRTTFLQVVVGGCGRAPTPGRG